MSVPYTLREFDDPAIWLIQANFIFYLVSYRKLSPDVIGIVLAAQGVGAVLGAAVAGRLIRQIPPARVLIGTTALAGLVTLFLIPLHSPVAIAIVWGLLYALGSINPVAWFTLQRKIVPNELLGRVVATTRMLAFASIPVSAMVAGVIDRCRPPAWSGQSRCRTPSNAVIGRWRSARGYYTGDMPVPTATAGPRRARQPWRDPAGVAFMSVYRE